MGDEGVEGPSFLENLIQTCKIFVFGAAVGAFMTYCISRNVLKASGSHRGSLDGRETYLSVPTGEGVKSPSFLSEWRETDTNEVAKLIPEQQQINRRRRSSLLYPCKR
ncbi:hypothetical protein Ocin01_13672 [Orchesella cincta]|uniref:Uncharacterized protein n=1 Tax=Orchesella cincta TaxID=48709 RepID=A0A1D2MJ27_ORCCI|nr:hypothetical protein Ocin01_13672 [Orchesella cincta]